MWDTLVDGQAAKLWQRTVAGDRHGVPPHGGGAAGAAPGDASAGAPPGRSVTELEAHAQAFRAEAMVAAAQARTASDPAALEESIGRAHRAAQTLVETARGIGESRDREAAVEEARAQLDAVRRRAEGWRNGVGATFTLILATLALKPGEGFMAYAGTTKLFLGLLLAASVLLSLVALLLLVRAANGPGWLKELSGHQATRERYLRRAQGAYFDFVCGRWAWAVSLGLFLAAVTVTWFVAPPA